MERSVTLHFKIRTAPHTRQKLLDFLRTVIPIYEKPDGVRIRLLRSLTDPDAFVEIAEYQDREHYERDQERVESDTVIRAHLNTWRSLLVAPVTVEAFEELTAELTQSLEEV